MQLELSKCPTEQKLGQRVRTRRLNPEARQAKFGRARCFAKWGGWVNGDLHSTSPGVCQRLPQGSPSTDAIRSRRRYRRQRYTSSDTERCASRRSRLRCRDAQKSPVAKSATHLCLLPDPPPSLSVPPYVAASPNIGNVIPRLPNPNSD